MHPRVPSRLAPLLLVAVWAGIAASQATVPPRPGLEPVVARVEAFINREMKQQSLPAVSIALVEGKNIVWARGFGQANPGPGAGVAADAETVHRAGSVSKLFTDLAVMQLVEKGELDLDAPVTRYLPDFAPKNPFQTPITLRHLMSHRSGLVRESPVGHYFDPTSPSLADTVASLNSTELVYSPGTRTKYSNAGIAVVGRVVEKVKNTPYAAHVQHAVLDPLKLASSSFDPPPALQSRVADGLMWTYDGRTFPAPKFLLGIGPAGNLYTTVNDLGRFIIAMLDGGKDVVKTETLHTMWTPQFAAKDATTGFGLGFNIGKLDGHRTVGHNGAVYGFATEVSILPDDDMGVAVVVTKDCANTTASRIGDGALRMLLALKKGLPLPDYETTEPLPPGLASRLEGRYEIMGATVDFTAYDGRLFHMQSTGGFLDDLRKQGDAVIPDGPLRFGPRLSITDGSFMFGLKLRKVPSTKPGPPPAKWQGLIGEYGWDHDTLFILEDHGRLFALIEWFFFDPLDEVTPDVYKFPANNGLYPGESLKFTRDPSGRATQVEAASVVFKRRKIDGDDGTAFHITPVRPVAELRPEALKASPPVERAVRRKPDLVDLTTLDPTIKLDIRYATANNFLGTPFYSSPRAFMQRPAAEALLKAHQGLKKLGYGLLIHDAYRPWHVTKMFYDATPESGRGFVADPAKGSRHNRGCAVDLTLYDLATGKPIEMVGGYDEFSARSSPAYPGGTSLQRWHRDRLRKAMEGNNFTVNEVEWWHFDFNEWEAYPILNATFEELAK